MSSLRDQFQGCLVGAVIGDCLGSPFEGKFWSRTIDKPTILRRIGTDKLVKNENESMQFTDDTAMTRSICSSLLECKKYDAVDMATRFTKAYMKEGWRGYGGDVIEVFKYWSDNGINKNNVYTQSKNQFDGSGSYGNGAAMRVAPVSLFAKSKSECMLLAKHSALLTHSHKNGYIGAILQALAIYHALHNTTTIKPKSFLQSLREDISVLEEEGNNSKEGECKNTDIPGVPKQEEKCDVSNTGKLKRNGFEEYEKLCFWTHSTLFTFTQQLHVIEELLSLHNENVKEDDRETVMTKLGNGVIAQQAVPAAIYSFLRNLEAGFEEALYYAISLGGDTDTIGSMCAAIAGGYYGYANIPPQWIKVCEGCEEMTKFANKFHDLTL